MVVPPHGGSSSMAQAALSDSTATGPGSNGPRMKSRNSASTNPGLPLSARRADGLDLSTVERKGNALHVRDPPRRIRPHGLQEAPTFRPTEEEFRDPMEYMRKIAPEGMRYGIAKIIPPDNWAPDFAIDTERFHFRTRKQELNSVEGGTNKSTSIDSFQPTNPPSKHPTPKESAKQALTNVATRSNLNYLDQLAKFHKQHGNSLNRFPSVDKRPLDLYKLKIAVESRGGFETVCKVKKWAEIGRDLGYSGKIMSSLSTSLKNSYQKWLHPYEEYLRIAKPGVQQLLEFENGGPFTPSPGPSPMRKSFQTTPSNLWKDSPAIQASNALQASVGSTHSAQHTNGTVEPPRPITSGFTAVNSGGFTAVNAPPSGAPAFTPVNGVHHDGATKRETPELQTNERSSPAARPEVNGKHIFVTNGVVPKRPLSEGANGTANGDSESPGRRSKRRKKDSAPTVTGSHMIQPKFSTPRLFALPDRANEKPGEGCNACGKSDDAASILQCDSCDQGYHMQCLEPPLKATPDSEWNCPKCLVGTGEFGFEEGGIYSLKQFQEKAKYFKENYFAPKMPYDPVLNTRRLVTEDDVEREFWRLVQSITETVEVEYGADIHSTTHGSGFPTIERDPRDPYSIDPWNLNNLPLSPDSLFRHIKTDISGMTVPWLYVGMCFSTFCWHNEDHYTYSANYQHFGDTKTWYGIPGEDATKFEEAMRAAVPELFESQPDLLFQLVTLLPPDQLMKAGVRVYALDQRAGQFVITYPQAYHAGFNHGFNFNEAVNFAPSDWEPFGQAGVERLRDFRRQPCFSHDELLLAAAVGRDVSIKTAKWLAPALQQLLDREERLRSSFDANVSNGNVLTLVRPDRENFDMIFERENDKEDLPEEEYICSYCKGYSYLSRFVHPATSKVACLDHYHQVAWDEAHPDPYKLHYRVTTSRLQAIVQKIWDKARMPELWQEKFEKAIEDDPKPQLKVLRSLVSEAERIPWDIPELPELRNFVDRCNAWVDEAMYYITRKQQNRRKNEKAWRKGSKSKVEEEERERDSKKLDNISRLLEEADRIGFDCAEIASLQERADAIETFQSEARTALAQIGAQDTQKLEDLVELGRSFFVEIPEVEQLDTILKQMRWTDKIKERVKPGTLQDVKDLIQQGIDAGISEQQESMALLIEDRSRGEIWEAKASELITVENVHFAQLDSFSRQAAEIPVNPETLATVDAILKKQREAQDQIVSLYERTKLEDLRQRPHYKEVRDVMEALSELSSKPTGTIDLEKEQKRHEDWMRAGKKLFGKSNAPLHILLAHMQIVEARNEACFDLEDKPKDPVEPSSREHTPEVGISGSSRDVFCICRTPEAGMMIECHVCREWYHGKCFKVARGKVKEEDDWTCPICDWRVKIPRDAARPKLEELMAWQSEIATLPFQPEEETCLANIIDHALKFREFISYFVSNDMVSTQAEVPDQRFYLRKIEGADILLTLETNFFRQQLHRLVPIAPEPPPIVEESASTRKPRPTKQQKLMKELGVSTPDELPEHLRPKASSSKKKKEESSKDQDKAGKDQHTPANKKSFASPSTDKSWGDAIPGAVGPASLLRRSHPGQGREFYPGSTNRADPSIHSGPELTLRHDHEDEPSFNFPSSGSNDPYTSRTTLAPRLGSPRFDPSSSTLDPNLFGVSATLPPIDDDEIPHPPGSSGSAAGSGTAFESMFADLTNHGEVDAEEPEPATANEPPIGEEGDDKPTGEADWMLRMEEE